jgi:hypothetical protein
VVRFVVRFGVIASFTVMAVLDGARVQGQTLTDKLTTLLTEQRPSPVPFVPDPSAAAATLGTVAGLLSVELATLPVASSSGGFVYRLNPNLAVVERASDAFGPFFTERSLQNGRGQTSFGISFQYSNFTSLQGAELGNGTFPTNAARITGATEPFSVDTLQLDMHARSTTITANHGVTDRLAVGVAFPIVTVSFSGSRVRTVNGQAALQSSQQGSATGLGDISASARYLLTGDGNRGVSVGTDLRLPTGRQEDLLGAGSTAGRFMGIGSWEDGHLAVHVNGGFGVGGVSRELFWNAASTFAAAQRVTIVGEVIGRYLTELSRVQAVYQSSPLVTNVEYMRWLGSDAGIQTTFLVTGAKWNLARSWLLNTSVLIRVTDAGLRARVTPAISIDYAFER